MSSPSTPKRKRRLQSKTIDGDESIEEIRGFFGCYLLVSRNDRKSIRGRTYIGFTVNPNRRILQHNAGTKAGGAWKTSKRGPWDMILLVHGFPNQISALRFEWAWQHPNDSRRLKALNLKKGAKEKQLDYRIRIAANMLRSEPWTRLCLTIRWLKEEYKVDFPHDLQPPPSVRLAVGAVKIPKSTKSIKPTTVEMDEVEVRICRLCAKSITKTDQLSCPFSHCIAAFHILCLARRFLRDEPNQLLPVQGRCPDCSTMIPWTDIIRHNQAPSVPTARRRQLASTSSSPSKSEASTSSPRKISARSPQKSNRFDFHAADYS